MVKAQGALEYLLIIGGAILIAAIVIMLAMGAANPTADTAKQSILDALCAKFSPTECTTGNPAEGCIPGDCILDPTNNCKGNPSKSNNCLGGNNTTPTSCTPKTCTDYPGQCATNLSDGCTGTIDCSNNCQTGQTCNGTTCEQTIQTCSENTPITTECQCGTTTITTGYCCNQTPQTQPCTQNLCGNGQIDSEEVCDTLGPNLNGKTCNDIVPGTTGNLGCAAGCTGFDTSQCTNPAVKSIYVDNQLTADCTTGNYDIATRTCSGSDGKAYNTIQKAANNLVAGDTVLIRGGSYNGAFIGYSKPVIGTPNSKITFKNYNNEEAIIQGTQLGGYHTGFFVWKADYTVFKGLKITGGNSSGMDIYMTNNISIIDCTIYANNGTGIKLQGVSNSIVEHNEIYDNHMGMQFIGYSGSGSNGLFIPAENNAIQNNLVYNNRRGDTEGSDGIAFSGGANYNVIRNNVVFGNADDGIDSDGYAPGSNYNIIENNISFGNGFGQTGGDGNGIKVSTNSGGGHIVGYNIVFGNSRGCMDQDREPAYPQNKFYNNTCYETVRGLIMDDPSTPIERAGALINNIAVNNSSYDVTGRAGSSINNFYNTGTFSEIGSPEQNRLSGDPKFNNPSLAVDTTFQSGQTLDQKMEYIKNQVRDKLSLKQESTAIDAGTIIQGYHCQTAGAHSGENCKEWYGSAPDIGAYEYH